MKNIAASVQARLRNLARQEKKDYVLITRLYMQEAIRLTFTTRRTIFPEEPAIFRNDFSSDPRNLQLWKGFLNRTKAEPIQFDIVISEISRQLLSVYKSLKE